MPKRVETHAKIVHARLKQSAVKQVVHTINRTQVGIGAHDPATFFVVAIVLLGLAVVACWLPARRASRINPMVALHYEW